MTPKLLKDISASTLQVVINQSLGVVVFLITSFYLPKENYGELNWSFAIFTFTNNLLSLRLEQLVVKKAATGPDSSTIMTLFMIHIFLSGTGFYLLLLILNLVFPGFFSVHNLLLIVGISQLFSFFSSPFKQIANGKERFDYLAAMSSVNNIVRVLLLLALILFSQVTIDRVLIVLIIGSAIELLFCFLVTRFRMQVRLHRGVRPRDYFLLLKESLPQMGAAVLMAGITRLDWIFLGLFSTSIVTAEYSFAYRAYELSPFPLLIIAPVLLSRFSKYFAANTQRSLLEKKKELGLLIRAEMIVATFIPLVLNITWSPVIDALTGNKYGQVNKWTFFILSLCIPFQYISNIIWSAHFAQHRLKLILKIIMISFVIVLVGDSVFIPMYGALGAAIVYLAAMIVEYLNFMRHSELSRIKESWQSLLICMMAAAGSGFAAVYFFSAAGWQAVSAIALYFLLLLATRQLRVNDLQSVLRFVKYKSK
ncbi:MAG: oligosaccharide flippase family protein [Chitinophagaceae bacterium]